MDKKEKEERRRQEDQALNRGLCWVGGAVILEFLLVMIKRHYIDIYTDPASINLALKLDSVLRFLQKAVPVVFIAAVVWLLFQMKKHGKTALPLVVSIVSLVVTVCIHIILSFKGQGVQMLYLMVPVLAGLALSYYIYQKEFFLCALAGSLAVLGLWFVRFRGGLCMESILLLVGIALVLVLVLALKKQDGKLPGSQEQFAPQGVSYMPALASCLIGMAALVLAMLMGATVAYYLLFAMVAWVFALLVYYTVKMM